MMIVMPITAVAIYFSIGPGIDENVKKERPATGRVRRFLFTIGYTYYQIARILLNQGGQTFQLLLKTYHRLCIFTTGACFPRMRNAVYFVVGGWCLGALVLVCAYNSLLTSYILGSKSKPLVDSILELVQNSNIQLVVDKGRGTEIFLMVIIILK
jgi:hypothetical protein